MASKRDCNRSNINMLLESLFTVSDSDLIDASFDILIESRKSNSDQNNYIQRAIHILSVLLEAGKTFDRKRSSVHNTSVWPLPPDLTIKVFLMLDMPSVCSAVATCSFFQKCGIDPLCYVNIDSINLGPKANDAAVSTIIERGGNALQSIKLDWIGYDDDDQSRKRKDSPILTRSCLSSLGANGGASGSRLRILHLCNIKNMDKEALLTTFSVCPLLIDLEIVELHVNINNTLESLSGHCRLIERFIYRSDIGESACRKFVRNCPKITTLALKGCIRSDSVAFELVKGFQDLKHVDFSRNCISFTGAFLENLGTKGGANNLEVMNLGVCLNLKISAIESFMEALLEGKFRLLRHLDISYTKNLASFLLSSILVKQVLEQRPDFCLVSQFGESRFDKSPIIPPDDFDFFFPFGSEGSEESN